MDYFVGRQPILSNDEKLYAYELLFRGTQESSQADILDNIAATSRVILNTVQNVGIENIVGDKLCFINIDESIVHGNIIELLPADRFVLELLETSVIDDGTAEEIRKYSESGYKFAIDDAELDDSFMDRFAKIIDYVDIIKVDLMLADNSKLGEFANKYKMMDKKLLAEKVETRQEFQLCSDLGFDYFQGYYFEKPTIIRSESIEPGKLKLIEIINMLRAEGNIAEIEKNIKQTPELDISLLKFLNSASFFVRNSVSSIKQAITLLGYGNLSKWLMLMLYASSDNSEIQDNPLIDSALQRAVFMETVAESDKNMNVDPGSAYLTGLLSLIDIAFSMDIQEMIGQLNLDIEIEEALISREGKLGRLLRLTEEITTENFDKADKIRKDMHLNKDTVTDSLFQSVKSHF